MQTAQRRLGLVFVMVSIAMLLAGCAYTRRQQAERTEQLLSAAGFKIKTADTTAKFARIKAMPQLTLRPLQRQGKTYWVYPDAEGCHCAYLGNQTAYQRYQNLAVQ